jgi:hypothetical protein
MSNEIIEKTDRWHYLHAIETGEGVVQGEMEKLAS